MRGAWGIMVALWAPMAVAQVAPDPYQADFDACLEEAIGAADLRACLGQAKEACQRAEDGGETTVGLMFCALMERDLWDARLNAVYREQMDFARDMDLREAKYGDATYAVLEDSLRTAQRAWIPFRDAQCALEYAQWGAGSMRQVAGANCQMRMTAERVITLMTGSDDMVGE